MAAQDGKWSTYGLEGSTVAPVEKGQWVWNDSSGELEFLTGSAQKGRATRPRQRRNAVLVSHAERIIPISRGDLHIHNILNDGVVSLEDVKVVAVGLINESTVKRTHRKTCKLFDDCLSTVQLNSLVWATLIYFNMFLDHKRAQSDENVATPGSIGEKARETLKSVKEKLEQCKVNLGEAYSMFILGIGQPERHHFQAGRLRASKSQTDKEFFEILYEFIMYATWITFGYKDWDLLHMELGSFFRSSQFNRDFNQETRGKEASFVQVEGFGTIGKTSDEYLTYKVVYDRPIVGKLKELHSNAHISYLPEPKDKWVLETTRSLQRTNRCFLPTQWRPPVRLGIIGDSKKNYDQRTLQSLETDSEEDLHKNDLPSGLSDSESDVSSSGCTSIEDEDGSDDLS